MERMINGLETFVSLDLPFLIDEREQRISTLRTLLLASDITVSEKFRRVLEAYQIEIEYGRTIEAYRGESAAGETVEYAGAVRYYGHARRGVAVCALGVCPRSERATHAHPLAGIVDLEVSSKDIMDYFFDGLTIHNYSCAGIDFGWCK